MSRILVTGASGFVGSALVDRLARDGRQVVAAMRRPAGTYRRNVEIVVLPDLSGDTDWGACLKDIEVVIHVAARAHILRDQDADPLAAFRRINCAGTLAFARSAAAAGVRRFVFVSSIKANGEVTSGRAFTANDAPAPISPYGVTKWEAEQGLALIGQETGLEVVVVRPPLVIGSGAKGNLGLITKLLRRGIPIPFGAITQNRRDLVSREVLVDLLVTCIDHPRAAGGTFLVSDGVTRSTAEIVRALAEIEGQVARQISVPVLLIGAMLAVTGRNGMREQLLCDLEVDINATCKTLGWYPQRV